MSPAEDVPTPDPVFAAIAAHEAVAAQCAASGKRCVAHERERGAGLPPSLEAEWNQSLALEDAALRAVIGTVPTTTAGLAAWAAHLAREVSSSRCDMLAEDVAAVLGTVRAFAEAGVAS